MQTVFGSFSSRLCAAGLGLFLVSLLLPYRVERVMRLTEASFGTQVVDNWPIVAWMIVSAGILRFLPHSRLTIGKVLVDLLLALFALWTIRFTSTFFVSPGFGAIVGYVAVALFTAGALYGATEAVRARAATRSLASPL